LLAHRKNFDSLKELCDYIQKKDLTLMINCGYIFNHKTNKYKLIIIKG